MAAQKEVVFAGFGGQGVMTAGQLLAYTAMEEGKQVIWIPSYGPEMRGGTANCTVIVSDSRIGSPIINNPMSACVFNRPSLDRFGPMIRKGGLLFINSSLIDVTSERDDITELLVPANDLAIKVGNPKVANMVMLAAYVEVTGLVLFETLDRMLTEKLGGKKKEMLELNRKAFEEGRKAGQELGEKHAGELR
ncbi:MAG: 2-oxoacid:acceptor oxidoreductase family protein [Candidatus Zixiibacteriota bacterium]|nr:MAG: 2-oxoacid:acceptor oxidoreductase family protein [candidate division Zixibacteria bacterium]